MTRRALIGLALLAVFALTTLDGLIALLTARALPFSPELIEATLLYLIFIFVALPLYYMVAPAARQGTLLVMSLAYYGIAVSPLLTILSVLAVVILFALMRLGRPNALSIALFVLWVGEFYTWVPARVLDLPEGLVSLTIGFNINTVMLAILMRTFHRATFSFYEVYVRRVRKFSFVSFMNYMLGLPFLINSATPSFRHFLDCLEEQAQALEATILRGVRTCVHCLLCLYALVALILIQNRWNIALTYAPAEDLPGERPAALWTMMLGYHLTHYLRRMSSEQLSVGTWRLFGRNMRDNFISPLTSPNLVEYWRRWDVLWREYLVSTIYYPLMLSLGRRYGPRTPWIFFVSAFVTFFVATIYDFIPRGLFVIARFPQQALDWFLSLAIYHTLWGVLLGANLYWQAGRPVRRVGWGVQSAVGVVLTYVTVSLVRVFEQPQFSVSEKFALLRHSMGF